MKSNSNMLVFFFPRSMRVPVAVCIVLDLVPTRHHEDTVLEPQHLHLRAVETRQHRCGDHLIDRAERRMASAEIEHPIERSQQRIELVRTEQHRDSELPL